MINEKKRFLTVSWLSGLLSAPGYWEDKESLCQFKQPYKLYFFQCIIGDHIAMK